MEERLDALEKLRELRAHHLEPAVIFQPRPEPIKREAEVEPKK